MQTLRKTTIVINLTRKNFEQCVERFFKMPAMNEPCTRGGVDVVTADQQIRASTLVLSSKQFSQTRWSARMFRDLFSSTVTIIRIVYHMCVAQLVPISASSNLYVMCVFHRPIASRQHVNSAILQKATPQILTFAQAYLSAMIYILY